MLRLQKENTFVMCRDILHKFKKKLQGYKQHVFFILMMDARHFTGPEHSALRYCCIEIVYSKAEGMGNLAKSFHILNMMDSKLASHRHLIGHSGKQNAPPHKPYLAHLMLL